MTKALKIAGIVVAAIIGASITVAYYFIDPMETSYMPRCIFKTLTGWECPGCGSQRMLHALLNGEWAAAWHANPFLLAFTPFLLLLLYASANRRRHPRFYAVANSRPVIILFLAALVGWFILRNLL